MFHFEPQSYGCAPLLEDGHADELGLGTPSTEFYEQLSALDDPQLFGGCQVRQPEMAACCRAALWLLHSYLDESHQISQAVHTSTGSYWHAIMHRREGDFSNSKYWFRRTGSHPVFVPLAQAARHLADAAGTGRQTAWLSDQEDWNPDRFVDLCAESVSGNQNPMLARQVAQAEWQLLFDYCYRQAIGS